MLATTKRRAWIPVLAFLVALLAIGAIGFLAFKQDALEMERAAHDQLQAVADLKVRQAEFISRDNLLAGEAERRFQQGAPGGGFTTTFGPGTSL